MIDQKELERRKALALKSIRDAYREDDHENDVTMYVDHHLEKVDPEYWLKHTGHRKPDPSDVLGLLVFDHHWTPADEDDPDSDFNEEGLQQLEFTLPEGTTLYLICVVFDHGGQVCKITMEEQ